MMASELAQLKGLCLAAASPVVFSHNDLLSGNILVRPLLLEQRSGCQ